MFCKSCGREITGKPRFCPWCGQATGGEDSRLGAGQDQYSDSNDQNGSKSRRRYITVENIERYAPIAALAPAVMMLMSLLWLILRMVFFGG